MDTLLTYAGVFVALAFVLFALFIAVTLRRVVAPNEVHIVQTKKKTTSYGTGKDGGNVYYAWPAFLPVVGMTRTILPVNNFDLDLEEYVAYDKDRVPFLVDIVGFFRINNSDLAAQRVANFTELKEQILSILQGGVRKVLASHDIDTIMLERSVMGDQFTAEVGPQLAHWGVEAVKNVELMNITDTHDSKVIHNITAKRTSEIEKDSRITVASNQQLAKESEIAAARQVALTNEQAEQQVGERRAQKEQAVGVAAQAAQQEILSAQKETTARQMAVRQIEEVRQAEIDRDVDIVAAEQKKATDVIKAEGEKQQLVLRTEGEKQQLVLRAEGTLTAQQMNAQGIRAEGQAKGDAETAILQAPVTAQITLAKEIGSNVGYQQYLVTVRTVEANERIGIEQAKALNTAQVKVIATAGSPGDGIKSVAELFSPKGGALIGGMLEGVASGSDEGKAAVEKLTS